MMGIGEKAWFTMLLAALACLLLYLSFGLSPVARFVPLTVLIPTLILLFGQLVSDLTLKLDSDQKGSRRVDFFQSEVFRQKLKVFSGRAASPPDIGASLSEREGSVLSWLLMVLVCIYLFGFAVSMPSFILLYLKKRSGDGWLFSTSTALLAAGVL